MELARKAIRVCAAVVRDGARTLVCRRPKGSAHEGFWEFPGGKVSPGEGDHECLKREIIEELGCRILPFDVVYIIEHEYPGKHVEVVFYRAFPASGASFVPQEGQELRWVETSKLLELDLLPADRPLAKFLASGAGKGNKSQTGAL